MTTHSPQQRADELKAANQGIEHERHPGIDINQERHPSSCNSFVADTINDVMDDGMRSFYETHDRDGKELGSMPPGVENLSKVHAQETKSTFAVKGTYRAQFMQGKEAEYEATILAYRKICDKAAGDKIHHLDNCRRFAYFARDKTSGDVQVMTDSCRQRWCPMCAGQKAKYAKESTLRYIEGLKKPRFLTLTLRNEPGELLPQIQFLQDCFRRLRQRAYWKKNVTGGIWFLQVKRGKNSGHWHPHFHILLDGNYLESGEISRLWDLVTYGSPIIDIRVVHDLDESAEYVARYSSRPAYLTDMTVDDRIEVMTSLHGKRLSGTFGNAKCVTLTPPKIVSDSEWEQIGYYDTVVSDSLTNLCAKAVLIAWKNETPLADSDFVAYSSNDQEEKFSFEKPKEPIQYLLDFYNSS